MLSSGGREVVRCSIWPVPSSHSTTSRHSQLTYRLTQARPQVIPGLLYTFKNGGQISYLYKMSAQPLSTNCTFCISLTAWQQLSKSVQGSVWVYLSRTISTGLSDLKRHRGANASHSSRSTMYIALFVGIAILAPVVSTL